VKGPLERRQERAALLFLAPALLLLGVFFLFPVLAGLALSLTDFDVYAVGSPEVARFVGLHNYRDVLSDQEFWNALRNTLYFAFVGGPLSVLASLAAALLVNAKLARLKGLFRTVLFAPVVTTLVAVAIVWRYILQPRYGFLNFGLERLGLDPVDWLGDPLWSMPAIILLAVWKNFGYNMLILVAGLQSIPEELHEAAEVDGAGWWRRFRHVTLPSLAPTFVFVTVLTMIGNFQIFAEPYVMTQGGPLRSTTTVMLLMYEEGFRWWRMGKASAIAFLLFFVILAATALQLRLRREPR